MPLYDGSQSDLIPTAITKKFTCLPVHITDELSTDIAYFLTIRIYSSSQADMLQQMILFMINRVPVLFSTRTWKNDHYRLTQYRRRKRVPCIPYIIPQFRLCVSQGLTTAPDIYKIIDYLFRPDCINGMIHPDMPRCTMNVCVLNDHKHLSQGIEIPARCILAYHMANTIPSGASTSSMTSLMYNARCCSSVMLDFKKSALAMFAT